MIKRLLYSSFFIFIFLLLKPSYVLATEAQLACSPTTTTVAVGQTIATDIILNTRGFDASGATVILTYTPAILDTSTIALTAVTDTTGWTAPTTKTVDNTVGKITLDYGSSQDVFSDTATIGKVTFTGKAAGTSEVSFVFFQEYDDTTSGVAKVYGEKAPGTTSNILTDVVDCQYTVTGGSTPVPTQPGSTIAPTILPRTGSGDVSMVIFGVGVFLVFIGVFLTKFVLL
ncbi:LPXTG cell wall anchor domain-containing protein [Candidatus Gottesmanbacteria bacterium]|nr:LPXTG cell wall anchor domain-containing protein [Candidatus Gottesmanbacteria bacterium]